MSLTVPSRSTETPYKNRTALVVDDVEDMLDLLEIALHSAGLTVLRASNAADAEDLFEARAADIDLLMTDVRVGSDNGLELAKKLIAHKPSLHVLAISGFAIDGKVAIANTKIEFLPKPFSTSELKSKLAAIFANEPKQLIVTVTGTSRGSYTVSASCKPAEHLTRATRSA